MQSEPTVVPQHTSSGDLSPVEPSSTQHGHDFADGTVPLHGDGTGDPAALGQSIPNSARPSLNYAAVAPQSSPGSRVIQHENAGTSGRRGAELGFRVVASATHSELALDSLPNGKFEPRYPLRSAPTNHPMSHRGPHPYPLSSAPAIAFRHYPRVS